MSDRNVSQPPGSSLLAIRVTGLARLLACVRPPKKWIVRLTNAAAPAPRTVGSDGPALQVFRVVSYFHTCAVPGPG